MHPSKHGIVDISADLQLPPYTALQATHCQGCEQVCRSLAQERMGAIDKIPYLQQAEQLLAVIIVLAFIQSVKYAAQ